MINYSSIRKSIVFWKYIKNNCTVSLVRMFKDIPENRSDKITTKYLAVYTCTPQNAILRQSPETYPI